MRCVVKCLVGIAVLMGAGCRTTTSSEKFLASGYTAQPTRVVAAYYLSNDAAILDNRRLEEKLTAGLARCGVQARSAMRVNVSYDGFPAEFANGTTEDVDAVLVLSEGNNKTARFVEAVMGGRRGETGHSYSVALFERQGMTRVWGADINVHGSGVLIYSAQEKADHFARDLLGYLAADGLVACPKDAG